MILCVWSGKNIVWHHTLLFTYAIDVTWTPLCLSFSLYCEIWEKGSCNIHMCSMFVSLPASKHAAPLASVAEVLWAVTTKLRPSPGAKEAVMWRLTS